MAVSSSDRSFMQRIGQYKAASHAASSALHLAQPVADRLQQSWNLYMTYRSSGSHTRLDDPSAFYRRARTLGFYSDAS